ncbi:MAG TPA: 50S ribosomal protein L10 [Leptospiraceae bacterium]|nr:50S ribosomal protein L10 [Leptospiraceae bacterium]HMW06034.1 50S ribosomal protein L10 [Leptospiraceae bacterium]HMX35034.1 50S ribosomal protein L10 [Leptospiraceae bacterium]HMY31424.1 50S ribosomal protein L10 [Leptospiraceae bacterium]HMZ65615.1 50S ribosomal protein L10 [Leptospiraceae bacterium]
MANQKNIETVAELKTKLEAKPNFILAAYSGLTVKNMTDLRVSLLKEGSEMKVLKNNLFLRALKESKSHSDKQIDFGAEYKGPIAAIFSKENLPTVAKICKDFAKTNENLVMKGGFFDGTVLDVKGVEGIAGLPSREELLTQIAFGMNNVMSTLARAINAVAEKNAGGAAAPAAE